MRDKRGIFFSADALIALIIILFVVLISRPISNYIQPEPSIHVDILNSLSALKIYEVSLNANYSLLDQNKTLLEQMGELYVFNESEAKLLASEVLSDLNTTENVGIWFGDTLIFSSNRTPYESAKTVDVARQVITGIEEGNASKGFAARAFLSSDLRTKYFYFGGYVGDGNLSARIDYSGNITDMAEIEGVIINLEGNQFDLYVNNVKIGSYDESPGVTVPVRYNFTTTEFHEGENLVELRGESIYVAGGFIKIAYQGDVQINGNNGKYYFPGIDGLVNLYDGFYVPDNLTAMDISLHFDINYTAFLIIGNTTLFYGTTNGEETVIINNSEISSLLDYGSMEGKTVPLRLGLKNVSYIGITRDIDVFSVTDLSGSMEATCSGGGFWCCVFSGDFCGSAGTCQGCGGVWEDKLGMAKNANEVFINSILNISTNRVGLVGYQELAYNDFYHPLSNDSVSLIAEVNSWSANDATCICCGINKAANDLAVNSSEDKFRSMVVMSDGQANRQCAEQGTGSSTQDAIEAAQDACLDYGIVTHAVGFGTGADETTLQQIAQQGCNGSYYYSDASNLSEVYRQIAHSIVTEYVEQILNVSGEYAATVLYPDSYIDFTYNEIEIPYGLVITAEKNFSNEFGGVFSVPADAEPIITHIVSYSGPKWTTTATVNSNNIFDLSSYGLEFIQLGDPYHIALADSLIVPGSTNIVNVTTGISAANQSQPGSVHNKIIYTIAKNVSSFTDIYPRGEGCNWHIRIEEDNSVLNIPAPDTYTGSDNCYFNESVPTGLIADEYDAYQIAVQKLLQELDLNNNGKIDVLFTEQDLQITLSEIGGIPYSHFTEVQVRRWV